MLVHNGNLTNAQQLKAELWRDDLRHINTNSDTEVLLNVFAHALQRLHKPTVTPEDVFQAVSAVHQRCRGAYAVAALIPGYGLVAFRDPHAIRPLVYGTRQGTTGTEYMIASESVALDTLGFENITDISPGEAIYVSQDGALHTRQCATKTSHNPCLFEYVYLARPDSVIDVISVYKVRLRLGEHLAKKIIEQHPELQNIDVVMPIPDTSRPTALQLAAQLNVKYREGFVKNRYVGRTFIMPGQALRERSVKRKLNALELEFQVKMFYWSTIPLSAVLPAKRSLAWHAKRGPIKSILLLPHLKYAILMYTVLICLMLLNSLHTSKTAPLFVKLLVLMP